VKGFGVLRFAQEDSKSKQRQGQEQTTATTKQGKYRGLSTAAAKAPPSVEMTFLFLLIGRRTSNGKSNRRSLRDDKQKDRQRQKQS
jgi:hypothetical protein